MAGYSPKPLSQKLGIKAGSCVFLVNAPHDYHELLETVPSDIQWPKRLTPDTNIIHIFSTSLLELEKQLKLFRDAMNSSACIWASWPKRASKIPTDITEDRIRDIALPLDLVDIKVCAVSDVWSGLKLVVRREKRP